MVYCFKLLFQSVSCYLLHKYNCAAKIRKKNEICKYFKDVFLWKLFLQCHMIVIYLYKFSSNDVME